jgi:hypothetical protein
VDASVGGDNWSGSETGNAAAKTALRDQVLAARRRRPLGENAVQQGIW